MMGQFAKNLEVLKQYYSNIEEKIDNDTGVEIIPGYRGNYTAFWQVDNVPILLHSAYDPIQEANRIVEDFDFTQYSSLFVFGLGLGYHVLEILKRVGSQTVVYIVEPDWNIIAAAARVLDFAEILGKGRVILVFGTEAEIRARLDGWWTGANYIIRLHHPGFFIFPPLQRFRTDWVRDVRHKILELIHYHRVGLGLFLKDNQLSITDIAAHDVYLARSPHPEYLKGGWRHPVVIVLAGPSVNKNIHVLKEWRNKVTIFCVNTVFNKLLDNGIIPDATFSLDRGLMIYDTDYQRDEPIPDSILFVGNPVVDPRIVTKFKHSIFVLSLEEAYQRELAAALDDRETIPAGLSVTHYTFSFARLCGASPIILIGQDLAFGEGGHTHASGTMYENDVLNEEMTSADNHNIVYIEGYYGGKVITQVTWRMFRDWYEMELAKNPFLVINATEGGARIAGTVQISLAEALEEYVGEKAPVKASFLQWILAGTDDDMALANMLKIKKSFEIRKGILQEIEKISRKALKYCRRILSTKLSERQKLHYVDEVLKLSSEIINDNWVYTVFRPEFVRLLEKCRIGLEGGSLAASPEEKATYLQEMFIELLLFLPSLTKALTDGITQLDKALQEEAEQNLL